jgi:hypothetical protein
MAWLRLADYARTTLAAPLTDAALTATVDDGSRLPDTGPMLLTLYDAATYRTPVEAHEANALELLRCTDRSGDTLTIERGPGALSWPAGTAVLLAVNAAATEELQAAVDSHSHDGTAPGGTLIDIADLTGWTTYDGFTLRGDTAVTRGAANRLDIGTAGAPDNLRVWGSLQIGATAAMQADAAGIASSNLWTDALVELARWQFAANLRDLIGTNLLGLWIPRGHSSDTVRDWSGNGRHGDIGAMQANAVGGLCRCLKVGGSGRSWTMPADSWQSFGNGATDSPFTIVSLIRPAVVAGTFPIIAKQNLQTDDSEYRFWWTRNNLILRLWDDNTGGYIGRWTNAPLAHGVWQLITATYDGSSAASGCRIYINGTRADTANSTSGSYTAMSATAAGFGQYIIGFTGSVLYPQGCMGATALIAGVPDDDNLNMLHDLFLSFGGIFP